jgi:hypothetical protein
VTAIGVDIPAHLDIYEPAQQSTNPLWVNGPNSQFIKTLRYVQHEGSYETMFLMEGDTVPVKPYWMDKLLVDIEEQRPFAILGRYVETNVFYFASTCSISDTRLTLISSF